MEIENPMIYLKKTTYIAILLIVMSLFHACASSNDDDDSTSCNAATGLSDNSACLIVDSSKIEGARTTDSSITNVENDPFVDYTHATEDGAYRMIFMKDYAEDTTDYPSFLVNVDGFDVFFAVDFSGTPAAQEVSLDSSGFSISMMLYSPSGTSDLYLAQTGTSGTSAAVTISAEASSVGDSLQGTIGESVLCKIDDSFSLVDDCATSITISSGSFNVVRQADTEHGNL